MREGVGGPSGLGDDLLDTVRRLPRRDQTTGTMTSYLNTVENFRVVSFFIYLLFLVVILNKWTIGTLRQPQCERSIAVKKITFELIRN